MPTSELPSKSIPPVPVKYSGKWIVWRADHMQILAHSDQLETLWQFVQDQKIVDPIYEKVPRADVRFIGSL